MKGYSKLLIIRELQIKTTMWYHLIPVTMTIKHSTGNKAGQDMEKMEPSYNVGGNVNWYSLYGANMEIWKSQYGSSLNN